ncbi:MAG: acyl-CoA dehydrogenase family protein [Lentimicrobiaceae bacterium]|nr:acyl-CoA dehydrogenase family protein [Lentimicrobiaceae bacterium]MCB9023345.1 acyl-CoA dehydrogenase family protein [Lentimicrobiaceae bacterium]HPG32701.1 acyl-CoA dehydrogenase family protein [Lentimicrobium sp.]
MENRKVLKSGEFLVDTVEARDVFIPEEFDDEQVMIAQTCQDFLDTEVYPVMDKIDSPDIQLMKTTLQKSGELGLMGIALPEEYGGFGQSFVTQMLAAEKIGAGYSFSVAFMAHCGIGTLPIAYYGNDTQREKYVTRLATGELLGAYCLTEPGAGSDANAGKTNARLSDDGTHYILNGQKMWITNAGFADVQTVFAKVGNDRILSAFIVEKDMPGVVVAPDEKKMGIKGSSTAQIFYNDVKVPVENMIGSQGEGFRIALSILHMGRIKLGANVLGAAKKAINDSVQYANERKQFCVLISSFGAIKHKLAQQAIITFAAESAVYRVSKDIDDLIEKNKKAGLDRGRATIEGISHYAVEAAILKVYGSEALDFVIDEAVQIHGGMGYSAEMDVERGYRDSRINRIFEGTNEINRLLIADTAIKRAQKGEFDLFGPAESLYNNLDIISSGKNGEECYFAEKRRYISNFKKTILLAIHGATRHFDKKLVKEQEVMNNISEMIMQTYIAESLALRIEKLNDLRGSAELYRDMLDVYVYDAADLIRKSARDAVNSFAEAALSEKLNAAIEALTQVAGINVKEARRRIADKLIEDNAYKF